MKRNPIILFLSLLAALLFGASSPSLHAFTLPTRPPEPVEAARC